MNAEEAEVALARWRANDDERDRLVRQAYAAGLTPMRIHQVTGIARTTIYRILDQVDGN